LLARRELDRVTVVVEAANQAVDPAETERLFDGSFVIDARPRRVALVEHEPDLGYRAMVALEPGAPIGPRSRFQRRDRLALRQSS
jgi:hypothetical protein